MTIQELKEKKQALEKEIAEKMLKYAEIYGDAFPYIKIKRDYRKDLSDSDCMIFSIEVNITTKYYNFMINRF